jgi:acetylglutamate kinase
MQRIHPVRAFSCSCPREEWVTNVDMDAFAARIAGRLAAELSE